MKKDLLAELALSEDTLISITPLINELVAQSRAEKGCIRYEVFKKIGSIVIIEAWVDDAALEEHKTQKHFTDLVTFIESNDVVLTISELSSF